MRLASIEDPGLPTGTLHSLDPVLIPDPARPLPVSFDQRRHLGEGDRAGSWIAISFRTPLAALGSIEDAWLRVVDRHAELRTVFSRDGNGEPRAHEARVEVGTWYEHPIPPGVASSLGSLLDITCRPFCEPSHRLAVVLPTGDDARRDPRPVAVIASDHAHVDMWSLTVLARDLLRALGDPGPLPPVASFSEHTALLAAQGPAPEEIREAWHRVLEDGEGTLPRFPLPLGDTPARDVIEIRDVLDRDGVAALDAAARAAGTRPTALAVATLAEVTERLSERRLRAVFPVHSRSEPRWHEACGWFITNAVLDLSEPTVSAATAAIKQALRMGSVPLAPIFAPHGGQMVPSGMFAISWMDMRRMPVGLPEEADARAITSRVRTDGVMIWFVLEDTGLHLRCRYPDTPEARDSVDTWLDGIVAGLRSAAS
jgi:hypothetical protein